jgi:hypothetical protein
MAPSSSLLWECTLNNVCNEFSEDILINKEIPVYIMVLLCFIFERSEKLLLR